MVPFRGYWRQKNISTEEIANPASNAADKTSVNGKLKSKIMLNESLKMSRTIILRPPREVTASNNIVENEPDYGPRNVVDSRSRWDRTGTIEDDGEVNVLDNRIRPFK